MASLGLGVTTARRATILAFIVSLLAFAWITSLAAQGPKPATPKPKAETKTEPAPITPPSTHAMTTEDIGAFLDGIMPQQLGREDIAGAVISVVKDGKVLFAKGYGYSDVEKKIPVSADDTLFRPGSI